MIYMFSILKGRIYIDCTKNVKILMKPICLRG